MKVDEYLRTPQERPLSIRIGRIVLRLAIVGLLVWGGMSAYRAYVRKQRAQEIAPIHAYALGLLVEFKKANYFAVQEHLSPQMQRTTSVDWLAYYAERAELNATQTGTWQAWSSTEEENATIYSLAGTLVYANTHTKPMAWKIRKDGENMRLLMLKIGERSLEPKSPLGF